MAQNNKSPRFVFLGQSEGVSSSAVNELDQPFSNDSISQVTDPLQKSILNAINGVSKTKVNRLAFTEDPSDSNVYEGLYKNKRKLIPDAVLKQVAVQDHLVACVIRNRANHISQFGREQPTPFDLGFKIEPRKGLNLTEEQEVALSKRIREVVRRLLTCGSEENLPKVERMTFAQFLYLIIQDGMTCGRFAKENTFGYDVYEGKKVFKYFRPIDVSTIFKATPLQTTATSVRRNALSLLEQVKGEKLEPEKYLKDEYSWVQVINGRPVQAFTETECDVYNLYPVTDIIYGGYPVSPLDTVISAVLTHINITTHNRLYFQNGRASRSMIVIKSDDVDESVLKVVRQQMQASINASHNAFRTPVFKIGPEDEVENVPLDSSGRDMEFQYLYDQNIREILAAYQMSPDEVPGYSHLSKSTTSQALSESNNQYKLTAARDVGLNPLVAQVENFVNRDIIPLFDETVATLCVFKFAGLDADTPEKLDIRIQQAAGVHMTYNQIQKAVEKPPVPRELGGDFPLNQQFQQILEKYLTFGEILEFYFNKPNASQDPTLQFYQNPVWMQWVQMQQQMQMQQQQAQMQAQGGTAPQGQGGPQAQGEAQQGQSQSPEDIQSGLQQASQNLNGPAQK